MLVNYVKTLWQDFVFLIYPRVCLHCQSPLVKNEEYLCFVCNSKLPLYPDLPDSQNTLLQSFAYLKTLRKIHSLLMFSNYGIAKSVLHELKYNDNYSIGVYFGTLMAIRYKSSLSDIDCIIPVPIHPKRRKKRGYNQTEALAEGISTVLKKPVQSDVISRDKYKISQTKQGKMERWNSLDKSYSVSKPEKIKNRRILLIDDVITTGATIGYLAELIEQNQPASLDILCLATGKYLK